MIIKYAPCRHCGKEWRPQDEVNVHQSYCSNCSKKRKKLADQTHMPFSRPLIEFGPYILSSKMYCDNAKEENFAKWHLSKLSQ